MKNKKLMLIATAAMGFVALGAAGVGTAAWYTATASASVTAVGDNTSVGTAASTLDAVSYKVKVAYTGAALTSVKLSDKTGGTWAIVGGYLRAATGSPLYGTTSTTVGDYTVTILDSSGNALDAAGLATAKANLAATGTDYDLIMTGSATVRLSLTDPSSNFATAFGNNIANTVEYGGLSFDSGEPAISGLVPVYYSVSGNDDNTVPSAGDAAVVDQQSDAVITFSLKVHD